MRRSHATPLMLLLIAAAGVTASACRPARAAENAGEMAQAFRALEEARLRLRLFERVDYPLRLQEVDAQIKLTRAEVESFQRRIAEYERFDGSGAVFLELENVRLMLGAGRLRLQNLERERLLLQLHFKDERRLRQMQVDAAAQRVAETQNPR